MKVPKRDAPIKEATKKRSIKSSSISNLLCIVLFFFKKDKTKKHSMTSVCLLKDAVVPFSITKLDKGPHDDVELIKGGETVIFSSFEIMEDIPQGSIVLLHDVSFNIYQTQPSFNYQSFEYVHFLPGIQHLIDSCLPFSRRSISPAIDVATSSYYKIMDSSSYKFVSGYCYPDFPENLDSTNKIAVHLLVDARNPKTRSHEPTIDKIGTKGPREDALTGDEDDLQFEIYQDDKCYLGAGNIYKSVIAQLQLRNSWEDIGEFISNSLEGVFLGSVSQKETGRFSAIPFDKSISGRIGFNNVIIIPALRKMLISNAISIKNWETCVRLSKPEHNLQDPTDIKPLDFETPMNVIHNDAVNILGIRADISKLIKHEHVEFYAMVNLKRKDFKDVIGNDEEIIKLLENPETFYKVTPRIEIFVSLSDKANVNLFELIQFKKEDSFKFIKNIESLIPKEIEDESKKIKLSVEND